jgi:hypothetical protein
MHGAQIGNSLVGCRVGAGWEGGLAASLEESHRQSQEEEEEGRENIPLELQRREPCRDGTWPGLGVRRPPQGDWGQGSQHGSPPS